MKAISVTKQRDICENLRVAETFMTRARGLLDRDSFSSGEGLWIKPCKAVHTFGMRFPIDVIFLDRMNYVVGIIEGLPPNRITPLFWRAVSVLELPARMVTATDVGIGDRIEIACC